VTRPAEAHRAPGAFRWDAQEIDQRAAIEDGLRLLAAGQDNDRVSLRTIRPLYGAGGQPLLDDRGEHRRQIRAGTYDDFGRAAADLTALNAMGAHVYGHVQRSIAPITNAMHAGNIATVRREGIAAYTTVFVDIDPDTDAGPDVAITIATELMTVLVDIGVPRRSVMRMQSGRGGYLLIAIEPQPLTARDTIRRALQTIGRMVRAAGEPAHCDESVHDPARIARMAATVNHKRDCDPTVPAWILEPWTPGVRCAWSIIEKIASKSRPKLRAVPAGKTSADSASVSRRALRDLLADHGWLGRDRGDGITDITCPNHAQHSDGRRDAILYAPTRPNGPGWIRCLHQHCEDLTLFDWFRLLEGRPS